MNIEQGRIINDFIEPNKRQYMIPVYQRNYEWSQEQCTKLFEDIVLASEKDHTHFCGSVVYALLEEKHNIRYYVIIDGQQRLTTIYLMIKALLDLADTDKEKENLLLALENRDKFDEYGIDTASKLKLKPIKSDNNQLMLLMEGKYDKIDKNCGIWNNYETFCKLIKKEKEQGKSVKDIYRGLEKLICAKILLQESDNPQEIFERINSTGLPLSLADKIRNFVLMTDADQEKLYEDYWLEVEVNVGRQHMTDFFLDYLNFKTEGFSKEQVAYDDFKKLFKEGGYTNESMLKEVHHYAQIYHAFLYGDEKYSVRLNAVLHNLRRLKQTTVFIFLFSVFDDFAEGIIDQKVTENVLQVLLNYSIRRMACDLPSNSLRGLYKSLYSRVFNRQENKEHYVDALVSFLNQLTSRDAFIGDDSFVQCLKQNNLYRKNALCKFLLSEIENQGKEHIVTDNLTIEHIMPQNKNLSSAWQVMLGSEWESDRDRLLHTLGNLTLTGYNSELGDKPFEDKKAMLEKNTHAVRLYADIKDCKQWNAVSIEERADKLAKSIVELFPMPVPDTEITFNDPNNHEYSCENPEQAKYKTPNYYVLQGERVKVMNFTEMLRSLINRLYLIDSSIIEDWAEHNTKVISSWTRIFFSYDKTKVGDSDIKIKNTDIYINKAGLSASDTIYAIMKLLECYDIDLNDFVYSARSNTSKNEGQGTAD